MKNSVKIMLCWVMHSEDLEAISKWGMHNALVIESSINWAITSHTRFSAKGEEGWQEASLASKRGPFWQLAHILNCYLMIRNLSLSN